MHHTFNDFKNYYKITVYCDMFRWQPPPSSGKVRVVSWNTAVTKQCLSCYALPGSGFYRITRRSHLQDLTEQNIIPMADFTLIVSNFLLLIPGTYFRRILIAAP
jgi:hypothetical protein